MPKKITKLRKQNILVIGINYSPEPTGSAPYTSGLAEMLVEMGHSVEAFVGIPHYPTWKVRPEDKFRIRSNEKSNGVSIRHFRHFVPRRQTAIRRILWELTFLLNVLLANPKEKPSLIICSTPSLSGALLGAYFSNRYRVPLITFVQDVLGEAVTKSGLKVGSVTGGVVTKLERFVFSRSTQICLVSPNFKKYVAQFENDSKKITIFPNWTHISSPKSNRSDIRKRLGWNIDEIVVLHTGNMGLKQDLGNVIFAARILETESKFRFILCGDGNQREYLMEMARASSNLEFLNPVKDSEYPDLLLAADILLVNERDTVGDMSLPSKLTSYLSIGQPIIAAVAPEGACAFELNRAIGSSVVVPAAQPNELADCIRELSADKVKMKTMSDCGKKYAEIHLTRAAAKLRLEELITQV